MSDVELWHFIRGAGLLAYGLLWVSVVLGISVRTRTLDGVIHRAWVFELHQTVGIMGVIATVLHIILVTQNVHVPLGWRQVFVPMSAEWRPWAVTSGVLGFYFMAIVGLSSLVRRGLPFLLWRSLHYASFPAWLFALVHGVLAGTDSGLTPMTWLYAVSAEVVVLLVAYRAFFGPHQSRPRPVLPERQRRPLSAR